MPTYPKIQTIFKRDPETNHRTLLEGQFSTPELELLADANWVWTEKVDGTNIRIQWDGDRLRVGGRTDRTDRAQVPTFLFDKILVALEARDLIATFDDLHGFGVVLYGEGYGAKIQKGGGDYLPDDCGFILFDVLIDSPGGAIWLKRESVEDIAAKIGVPVVPIVGRGTLSEMVNEVRLGMPSKIATVSRLAEGMVARPAVDLLDRMGRRIITKIKHKDFPHAQ